MDAPLHGGGAHSVMLWISRRSVPEEGHQIPRYCSENVHRGRLDEVDLVVERISTRLRKVRIQLKASQHNTSFRSSIHVSPGPHVDDTQCKVRNVGTPNSDWTTP